MPRTLIKALAITLILSSGTASASSDFLKSLKDTVNKSLAPTESSSTGTTNELGLSEVIEGLKEALKVGTERVVGQIGADGGYEDDPAIHIPLPEKMQ